MGDCDLTHSGKASVTSRGIRAGVGRWLDVHGACTAEPGPHPPRATSPAALGSTCSISGTREVASGLRLQDRKTHRDFPEAPILSSPAPAPLHRAPLVSLPPSGHNPLSSRRTPGCLRAGKLCQVPPAPGLPSDVRSYWGASLSQLPQPRAPLHSPARAPAAILALTARPGPPSSDASGRQGPGYVSGG